QPDSVDLLAASLRQPRHLPSLRPTLHDSSTPPRRTRSHSDTRRDTRTADRVIAGALTRGVVVAVVIGAGASYSITGDDVLWTDTIATTAAATFSTELETTGDLGLPGIPDSATQTTGQHLRSRSTNGDLFTW
ncbi:hypothetical protein, partial [Pseudonocardia sp. Ae717_Ps2]|uniref:hypothetical protein n=1 Tax=Pseudonocardia sp. Ae717_Ps2 TaxID=1885573 RepID=UPI001E586038